MIQVLVPYELQGVTSSLLTCVDDNFFFILFFQRHDAATQTRATQHRTHCKTLAAFARSREYEPKHQSVRLRKQHEVFESRTPQHTDVTHKK